MTALTPGHEASLRLLQNTDAVRATLDLYRQLATPAGVYLRPTAKGLTVISLDPACASMVGVAAVGDGRCYLTALPPSRDHVQRAADGYRIKLETMRRRSPEESFALACIRAALADRLRLPGSELAFVCQEWRLVASPGESFKIDLLALDPQTRQLTVIELKRTCRDGASALVQADGYVRLLLAHSNRLLPFFSALADAMSRIYGTPWSTTPMSLASPGAGRAEVWCADGHRAVSATVHAAPAPIPARTVIAAGKSESPASLSPSASIASARMRELAEQHHVWVPTDAPFQRRLRLGQALWREARGYPIGEHRGAPLGSRLQMPDAERELWNFLTPETGTLVRAEYDANLRTAGANRKLYGYPRLFNDLLSSQPLCFNLFGPLALDLDLATQVARRLWPDRVDRVTAVRLEHSPGRQDVRYLGNGTAADALLEHTVHGGGRGIIAIETKYHEDLKGKPATQKPRYQEVIEQSCAFVLPLPPEYNVPPLQQILLDHLLVLAMGKTDGLRSTLSVLMYPHDHVVCAAAAQRYRQGLDPHAAPTFETRTLESVCAEIAAVTSGGWVKAFVHRYLDLSRVNLTKTQMLAAT